ncbi:hypothetical protein FM107_18585 [Sphingobacterium sp. JB170]|nr:hypothetical protein FM107_18585 [Sphingobacterium sp. JB170]
MGLLCFGRVPLHFCQRLTANAKNVSGSGYPLQVFAPLHFIVGFPLLSLTQTETQKQYS